MDAVAYIKEKVRMCHNDPAEKFKCDKCPMFADTVEIGCVYWEETDPTEAVRIVEEWSKAHPIQTNEDKFKEVFGDVESLSKHGELSLYEYRIMLPRHWWSAPYEAPKGDNNG